MPGLRLKHDGEREMGPTGYLQVQLGARAHFSPSAPIANSGTPTTQTADLPTGHDMLQLPQAVFAFVLHWASPPGPKLCTTESAPVSGAAIMAVSRFRRFGGEAGSAAAATLERSSAIKVPVSFITAP